jgi:IS6 family transposase
VSDFKGRHFEGEIALWAVRWYCRYGVSYRDLEQMIGEGGVSADHSTIYRWVQRYAPEIGKRLRWQWRGPRSARRDVREGPGPVGVSLTSPRQTREDHRFLPFADARHSGGRALPQQGVE